MVLPYPSRRSRPIAGCIAAAGTILLFGAPRALAQQETISPRGDLEALPFDPPFALVEASVTVDADEGLVIQLVDAPIDACVDFFRTALNQQTELAPGWTVGGGGFDIGQGAWRFSLLHGPSQLYGMELNEDPEGCLIELESSPHALAGDYYRFSYPALEAVGIGAVAID